MKAMNTARRVMANRGIVPTAVPPAVAPNPVMPVGGVGNVGNVGNAGFAGGGLNNPLGAVPQAPQGVGVAPMPTAAPQPMSVPHSQGVDMGQLGRSWEDHFGGIKR